jgi:hypothetical protein
VAPSTSVRLEATPSSFEGSEELGLESGSIVLKVPKLGAHRRLSIHTPDATVTVRGTEFRVDVRQRDGHSTTAVTVLEGSVWVTKAGREITLEKGSNWSSEAAGEPPAASAAAADRAATGVAPPSTGGSVVSAVAPHAPGAASGREDAKSTLGAENDQYQRGVSAARGGDDNKAVSAFNMFLVRYPTSPLAQSAEVERFRALKRLGSVDEAARRARQYLAEYPAGFARVEAQNLAVQSLNPSGGP